METLSDEKGLRRLSYSQLVNLLKQFGISRHARDKKELMIGKLLRFSIHSKNTATIEEEFQSKRTTIERAKSIEALGKIDDRINMDTIIGNVPSARGGRNKLHPALTPAKKFVTERVTANYKTMLHHQNCVSLKQVTGIIDASKIQKKQNESPRRSKNTLLGHGKNGVGYVVLKIPTDIMDLCPDKLQESLKSLVTKEGDYLFMNAKDGSKHPSPTRLMKDITSLKKQPQSKKRKITELAVKKDLKLAVKDDVKEVISKLENLTTEDKENLELFFESLLQWLEQLDFIKERNLSRQNILMALIQSNGSKDLLDFFQGDHTDFDRSGINKRVKDNEKDKQSSTMDIALGALLSIDSRTETFLRIIPNSHKYNRNPEKHVFHKPQLIKLERGEIIFFHALLAHAGYGYEEKQNVRLHFYLVKEKIMNFITSGENNSILGTFLFDEHLKKKTKKKA